MFYGQFLKSTFFLDDILNINTSIILQINWQFLVNFLFRRNVIY